MRSGQGTADAQVAVQKPVGIGRSVLLLVAPRGGLIKPAHWLAFWLIYPYVCWMASPFFAYYVVGVPNSRNVTQLVGDVRHEKSGTYGRWSYRPPRTSLFSMNGRQRQIHCGYVMYNKDCIFFAGLMPFNKTTVAFHPYFGVLEARTEQEFNGVNDYADPHRMRIEYLKMPLFERVWPWLLAWMLLTAFWIVFALDAVIRPRRQRSDRLERS